MPDLNTSAHHHSLTRTLISEIETNQDQRGAAHKLKLNHFFWLLPCPHTPQPWPWLIWIGLGRLNSKSHFDNFDFWQYIWTPTLDLFTITIWTTTWTTRNSSKAGTTPAIAFGRCATTCPMAAPIRNHSDRTATDNGGADNPNNDGDGSEQGDDLPGGPDDDPPDDDGPGDHPDNPNNSDDDVQHKLSDAIAVLLRNVHHQGDGSCSNFWESDPFDGTDPTKFCKFLVQLQLSLNDRPRTFTDNSKKVKFTILYLKDIALAHFKNSLLGPDLWICLQVENQFCISRHSCRSWK